jgi:hypothetical protein
MKLANPKRSTTRLPSKGNSNWHEHVEPVFVAHYSARKKNADLRNIKDERKVQREFHVGFKELVKSSRAFDEAKSRIKDPLATKIQQVLLQSLGDDDLEIPELSPLFRTIVFLRYGISFRELIRQVAVNRDPVAHRKLMRVHSDYWRLLSGDELTDLKLKFTSDHFDIMTQGFDFGFEKLTPHELADCLDELCPCGQRHSPQYYKRVRAAIRRACKQLVVNKTS